MCNIPVSHPCFQGNYKTHEFSELSFRFEIRDGVFGYVMNNGRDYFESWDISLSEFELNFSKYIRVKDTSFIICPEKTEIPPIIWKIRQMELRRAYC